MYPHTGKTALETINGVGWWELVGSAVNGPGDGWREWHRVAGWWHSTVTPSAVQEELGAWRQSRLTLQLQSL